MRELTAVGSCGNEMTNDQLPPGHFFGHAVLRLRPTLEALGYRLVRQQYDDAAFGSAYAEYGHATPAIRLVWDGRDEALWADLRTTDCNEWLDVESVVSGRPPVLDQHRDDARLDRLATAIEALVKGRPTTR